MKRNNINSAIGLTSYFISLPESRYLVAGIVLFGLIFGLLIDFGKYPSEQYLVKAAVDGAMLLTLPALLSAVAVKLMLRKMPFRRIAGTALAGQVVYGLAYASSLLYSHNTFVAELILLLGSALVFVLWYVIARLVFILKYRSVLFAIVQLIFYLVFLLNSGQMAFLSSEPIGMVMAKFSLSAVILFGALYIFFLIINAPMKKNFGFSSTDAFAFVISQWLYQNKDMERAFEAVGSRAKTLVTVMGFRRKGGDVLFVTPCVHFGPFGNLGGSEFSHLIADELDRKRGTRTFVFHGPVTHDLNPVSTGQMANVIGAVDECLAKADYRPGKVSLCLGRKDECRAEALSINGSAFIGVTRAPYVTEDINFGLGLALMYEAEKRAEVAMLVDQHNAETGEITSFEPGDPVGYKYLGAVEGAMRAAESQKSSGEKLKIGVSFRPMESGELGKAGIKAAVVSSKPEYVILLVDSNGVTPAFRDRIESEVKSMYGTQECAVGVYTTDTHQTNMVRGVVNPLKAEDAILAEIKAGVAEARADVQEAQFFAGKAWFDIDVIGAKQSIEMISTINSVVAVAKLALPLMLATAILIIMVMLAMI